MDILSSLYIMNNQQFIFNINCNYNEIFSVTQKLTEWLTYVKNYFFRSVLVYMKIK